ncbi:glycosyltransferase family 2 protein [Paraburkholderia antibiotica]
MSTYNGEKFIRQQLNSLIAQHYSNWCLSIRDDGSSDATLAIIAEYQKRDARIRLMQDSHGNMGPARSFMHLLAQVESPIFMCCDQDDVWLPHKVGEAVARIGDDTATPRLFFTDLIVTDGDLGTIAKSFMAFQKFDPLRAKSFKGLLLQNIVVGCTMAGNSALLALLRQAQTHNRHEMLMHDWWFALLASAFGTIEYSSTPSILYRQHGGNSLGAPGSNLSRYITMLWNSKPWKRASVYICKVAAQSSSFRRAYGNSLTQTNLAAIDKVTALGSARSCLPLVRTFSAGIAMNGWLRNAALLLSVCVHPAAWNAPLLPSPVSTEDNA